MANDRNAASSGRFRVVVSAFGSGAGALLDPAGRPLDVVPADKQLEGAPIARRYAHLTAAEHGRIAVSNVVPSAARGAPGVAVLFHTPPDARVQRRVSRFGLGVASVRGSHDRLPQATQERTPCTSRDRRARQVIGS